MRKCYMLVNKHLGLWMTLACLLAITGQSQALRHIYYTPFIGDWTTPTVENASYFDDKKLIETAEGSNVYQGTIEIPFVSGNNYYFRFATELYDPQEGESSLNYALHNVITPKLIGDKPVLTSSSNNSAYIYTEVEDYKVIPPQTSARSWCLHESGTFTMRVDLNNHTLAIFPSSMKKLVVVNSTEAPKDAELANYDQTDKTAIPLSTGDYELRFYDAVTGRWHIPAEEFVVDNSSDKNQGVTLTESDNPGGSVKINDWKGGYITVLQTSNKMYIRPYQEGTPAPKEDAVYVVSKDAKFIPDATTPANVLGLYSKLAKGDGNEYEGTILGKDINKGVYFITELGQTPAQNKIFVPNNGDKTASPVNGYFYSRGKVTNGDNPSYYSYNYDDNKGSDVDAKVVLGGDPYVKFQIGGGQLKEIYIIGTMTNWTAPTSANEEFYSQYTLKLTDKGGYYGEFNIGNVSSPAFRFMTRLEGWTSTYSIGSNEEDFYERPVTLNGSIYNGRLVKQGLGNWSITDFQGPTLYCYVDLNNEKVTFSESPIEEAGNIVDGDLESYPDIYLKDGETARKFVGWFVTNPGGNPGIYLHNRNLPIGEDEPEYEGSYAISAVGGPVKFNDYGIAEIPYEYKKGINRDGANPFILLDTSGKISISSVAATIDPVAKKIIFDHPWYRQFLYGGITEGKTPNLDNYKDFEATSLHSDGGLLYIPAGKFNIKSTSTIPIQSQPSEEIEVVFTDGLSQDFGQLDQIFGWGRYTAVCPDWEGGNVIVTWNRFIQPSAIKKLVFFYWNGTQTVEREIAASDETNLRYHGTVTLGKDNKYLGLCLYYADDEYLSIGSRTTCRGYAYNEPSTPSTTWEVFDEEYLVIPQDGHFSRKIGGTNHSFKFPTITEDCQITFDLDLIAGTIEGTVDQTALGNSYEFVSEEGNNVDGMTGYPSTYRDNAVSVQFNSVPTGENVEFNIACSNGSVIAPEGDGVLNFDNAGVCTVPYRKVPTASGKPRKAASAQSKWSFTLPEDGTGIVNMLIDENESKLTVFATDLNKGFFLNALDYSNNDPSKYLVIENISSLTKNMLIEKSEGLYEGIVDMPENNNGLQIYQGFNSGKSIASWTMDGMNVFNIEGENCSDSCHAMITDGTYSYYELPNASAGKYAVKYDAKENLLTISNDLSAVGTINNEESGLRIVPINGGIQILSDSDAIVPIYNMQGMLIRTAKVKTGATFVTLPSGLYVVGSKKMMVR